MGEPAPHRLAGGRDRLDANADGEPDTIARAQCLDIARCHALDHVLIGPVGEGADQLGRAAREQALRVGVFEPVSDDMALGWEGCLSIPGITGAVPRHTRIRYRGMEVSGRVVEREASGFHARVVQHEIDHLDGVLFPMRMTDLRLLSFNEELRHFIEAETPGDDGDEAE